VRNERSRPLVAALETWLRQQRAKLSKRSETAKAIDYSRKRWTALTRFLDDGRLCMSNNAAERAVRCVAVGRKNWTVAGSDEGGHRAAAIYTLIETAKLNGIDPQVGSQTCSPDCRITRPGGSASCYLGIGAHKISSHKLLDQAAASPASGLPRGLHRMRTVDGRRRV
jgi:hypothetical protein